MTEDDELPPELGVTRTKPEHPLHPDKPGGPQPLEDSPPPIPPTPPPSDPKPI